MHCQTEAASVHFGSSAHHCPLATLPLHWEEGLATAITLVPLEGRIYYGQVYWFALQRTPWLHLSSSLPPSVEGATDDGDEPFIGPNRLISMSSRESSLSLAFCLQKLWLDDNTVINAHVSLLG